jgi:hypothetical protein
MRQNGTYIAIAILKQHYNIIYNNKKYITIIIPTNDKNVTKIVRKNVIKEKAIKSANFI